MKKFFISFILVVGMSTTGFAQKVTYFNFSKLPEIIEKSLKEAQEKAPFKTIEALKEHCITAKKEENIEYSNLPKAHTKKITTQELAKQIRASSLMICKYKKGFGAYPDFVLIGASAVVLSEDGLCVSNYHVFEPLIDEGQGVHPQDKLFFAADEYGHVYPITSVKTYSDVADLAVFTIDTRGKKLIPAPLGNDQEVGSTVHTMTHPKQEGYYYTQGVVARNSGFDDNPWENRCEITADFGSGSSGGPVFDDYGNLISVVSSTTSVYAEKGNSRDWQMVMKLTIPVSSVKRLIK
ncbi:S1 family peptidase [Thalassobellus citreus]|uniref:S1 family peptidase n=1 Tax=Thalassobellus citreus TaxID=3367752 RepID=UPI00379E5032